MCLLASKDFSTPTSDERCSENCFDGIFFYHCGITAIIEKKNTTKNFKYGLHIIWQINPYRLRTWVALEIFTGKNFVRGRG